MKDINKIKNIKNVEYINKLDKAFKQVEDSKVVVKTMEELEKMTKKQ